MEDSARYIVFFDIDNVVLRLVSPVAQFKLVADLVLLFLAEAVKTGSSDTDSYFAFFLVAMQIRG